ncbi:hypothetical protein K737_300106 [Holospora undulata HU1]|uniref:Uncharacterized protein n=1 Tax=Holospora undulata HU1 TaxID=1321371 RepID=A0A061JIM1_9PROT|nr:hypothetical protein K737_300106 [Holospora undulata HU1]
MDAEKKNEYCSKIVRIFVEGFFDPYWEDSKNSDLWTKQKPYYKAILLYLSYIKKEELPRILGGILSKKSEDFFKSFCR